MIKIKALILLGVLFLAAGCGGSTGKHSSGAESKKAKPLSKDVIAYAINSDIANKQQHVVAACSIGGVKIDNPEASGGAPIYTKTKILILGRMRNGKNGLWITENSVINKGSGVIFPFNQNARATWLKEDLPAWSPELTKNVKTSLNKLRQCKGLS